MNAPKPQAHPATHNVALRLIKEHLPDGAFLLDAGCGEGAFTKRLLDEGYRVVATDIETGRFIPEGVPLVEADLNSTLPFGADTFDGVVALEVVEHLDCWGHFVREAHRILKKSGLFLLSLPNILNLSSRLRYFFCGYPSLYSKARLKESHRRLHIALIPAPFLRTVAEKAGFRAVEFATDRYRRSALTLAPLLPLLFLVSKLTFSYDPSTFKSSLLFGRTLLALFQKE